MCIPTLHHLTPGRVTTKALDESALSSAVTSSNITPLASIDITPLARPMEQRPTPPYATPSTSIAEQTSLSTGESQPIKEGGTLAFPTVSKSLLGEGNADEDEAPVVGCEEVDQATAEEQLGEIRGWKGNFFLMFKLVLAADRAANRASKKAKKKKDKE